MAGMRRHSLRFRLLGLMIALTVVPVLVLTWIATTNTRRSVEREIIEANITRVNWAAQYLEELLLRLDGLFYSIQLDPQFDDLMRTLEQGTGTEVELARREMSRLLSVAYYAHSRKVDELQLYVHATGSTIAVDNVASGRLSIPDRGAGIWGVITDGPVPLLLQRAEDRVYALHTVNEFPGQELTGAIAARLHDELEDQMASILGASDSHSVYLLNERGELLIGAPARPIPNRLAALLDGLPRVTGEAAVRRTENALVFARRVDRGRLTVAKTVPLAVVASSARDTMTVGALTGLLLAAASVLLSVLFSLRISRPIVELAESMRRATVPDFDKFRAQSRDEIRLLEEGYHSLVRQMKALAQKEYEQEIELKDARLMALQAQINPHFLNNTLNLLGGMALAKGAPEVYKLARAVGDMFRYAVGSQGDLVSLEQELAHVRNYLLIQQNRFAGRCEVRVHAEQAVLGARIPRFTLQPLVENAFEHGLQKKPGLWHLDVICSLKRRGALLVVRDNGVGISRENLADVRMHLRDDDDAPAGEDASIGLRNVDTRLRLHFGPGHGIRVCSHEGKGTTVIAVLPAPGAEPEPMGEKTSTGAHHD